MMTRGLAYGGPGPCPDLQRRRSRSCSTGQWPVMAFFSSLLAYGGPGHCSDRQRRCKRCCSTGQWPVRAFFSSLPGRNDAVGVNERRGSVVERAWQASARYRRRRPDSAHGPENVVAVPSSGVAGAKDVSLCR
jgi:hypothetical protein